MNDTEGSFYIHDPPHEERTQTVLYEAAGFEESLPCFLCPLLFIFFIVSISRKTVYVEARARFRHIFGMLLIKQIFRETATMHLLFRNDFLGGIYVAPILRHLFTIRSAVVEQAIQSLLPDGLAEGNALAPFQKDRKSPGRHRETCASVYDKC